MRKPARVFIVAVAALALVADTGADALARKNRRPVLHDCGDPFVGSAPSGFTVELSLAKARYRRGEPVRLTLRVTNGSGETFTHFVGLPEAVFAVFKEDKLIWSSSWGKFYPEIAVEETFAPGETKTAAAVWQQELCRTDATGGAADPALVPGPPRAGTYTAQAAWRGIWPSNTVTFRIVRR